VVINFLNERNDADRRVLEILSEKFRLFSGVFGASDEVLGMIESGVDFEKRILSIYQECRSTKEIKRAFHELQAEMDEVIQARIEDTRKMLFENFDEDVHERLKIRLEAARMQLDRFSSRFWNVSKSMLKEYAVFADETLSFHLLSATAQGISPGHYHLITKEHRKQNEESVSHDSFLYRLSHPLGEYVIETTKQLHTPTGELVLVFPIIQPISMRLNNSKGNQGISFSTSLPLRVLNKRNTCFFPAWMTMGIHWIRRPVRNSFPARERQANSRMCRVRSISDCKGNQSGMPMPL